MCVYCSIIPNNGIVDSLDYRVKPRYNRVMRPLFHPSAEEITVQGILYALSDPTRVRIFLELVGTECSKNCSKFLNTDKTHVPKSTLSQHFTILREAGLIRSVRKGVELQNESRCAELQKRFGPLIKAIYDAYRDEAKRA